jgi:predicted nucleic acid-binding protein
MHLFWDTSAVVPLIFQELHSVRAARARAVARRAFAWSWMRVEAEAALLRRQASPQHWQELQKLASGFIWFELASSEEGALRQFNRALGLRASDAGHLYLFSKASTVDPGMQLVTFDHEMRSAAVKCSLSLWT